MPDDTPATSLPDLAALIGSRICHDLISPLGAIGNGVELLMMQPGATSPEMALIAESVANANARIRFFRVAFGMAGAEQRMARSEITSIIGDTARGGRIHTDWQAQGDLPRAEVKLAFLLLQCLESAMPFGGQVTVSRQDPRWQMTARATRLKVDPALWAVASDTGVSGSGTQVHMVPAHVHFALVAAEIARQSRRLAAEISDTEIHLAF